MDLAGQRLPLGQPRRPLPARMVSSVARRSWPADRSRSRATSPTAPPASTKLSVPPARSSSTAGSDPARSMPLASCPAASETPSTSPATTPPPTPGGTPGHGRRHRIPGREVRPLPHRAHRHRQPGNQVEGRPQGQVGRQHPQVGRGRATVSHPVQAATPAMAAAATPGRLSSPAVRASTAIQARLTQRKARIPSERTACPRSASEEPGPEFLTRGSQPDSVGDPVLARASGEPGSAGSGAGWRWLWRRPPPV